jgi:hypothetical protein
MCPDDGALWVIPTFPRSAFISLLLETFIYENEGCVFTDRVEPWSLRRFKEVMNGAPPPRLLKAFSGDTLDKSAICFVSQLRSLLQRDGGLGVGKRQVNGKSDSA